MRSTALFSTPLMSLLFLVCATHGAAAVSANDLLTARDLCTTIAKFAHSTDSTAPISYDQGAFKIVGAKGSLTVQEKDLDLTTMPLATYSDYYACVKDMASSLSAHDSP
jgi:hypothetical protein